MMRVPDTEAKARARIHYHRHLKQMAPPACLSLMEPSATCRAHNTTALLWGPDIFGPHNEALRSRIALTNP